MVKVPPPWQRPSSANVTFQGVLSGRPSAARHSQEAAGPLGAQPLPPKPPPISPPLTVQVEELMEQASGHRLRHLLPFHHHSSSSSSTTTTTTSASSSSSTSVTSYSTTTTSPNGAGVHGAHVRTGRRTAG